MGMDEQWRSIDLSEIFEDLTRDLSEAGVPEDFEDRYRDAVQEGGERIADVCKEHAAHFAQAHDDLFAPFLANLQVRWRPALNVFATTWHLSHEEGARFSRKYQSEATESREIVFFALRLLHARACRISGEVFALLRGGFASGALARWRTLHEIAVVANLIGFRGDDSLADRYLAHQAIHDERDARSERQTAAPEDSAITDAEYEQLLAAKQELLDKYGPGYDTDYGWAVPLVGVRKPSFHDLEKLVDQDRWRPIYKAASHPVHSGAKEAVASHVSTRAGDRLLTGPTNVGLSTPGYASLASLLITTTALLLGNHRAPPDSANAVIVHAMDYLVSEAGHRFTHIEQEISEEEVAAWSEMHESADGSEHASQ